MNHDTYPLRGGHRAVACSQCHIVEGALRRFAGTPRSCSACHENPHGNQFAMQLKGADCTACHASDAGSFRIRPYEHKNPDWFFLGNGHRGGDCSGCHFGAPDSIVYSDTSRTCSACHMDIHRGQFRLDGKTDCMRCHLSTENWQANGFNHETQSGFSLKGGHVHVACSACHRPVPQLDGALVIQYKPLTTRCEDCHGFESK